MANDLICDSKVLVTGGAGFIGSNLVDKLLSQNNQVVCLDNFSTGKIENLDQAIKNRLFTLIEGDIRDYGDCKDAVAGCEYVLHQAALGSVPRSIDNPVISTEVNIIGFVNMLTASVEAKVKRFIYASSSSVYGDSAILPKVEHKTGLGLSPYAITKNVNEQFARNFSELYGIETIGLRYFNVYGNRQDPNGAYAAVIPKFFLSFIEHNSPVIYGSGDISRDFTYIEDVLWAIEKAAVINSERIIKRQDSFYTLNGINYKQPASGAISEVFNVAYGSRTILTKLAKLIREKLSNYDSQIKDIEILHGESRKGDIQHSLASVDKLKGILGYYPKYDLNSGLEKTAKWYFETFGKRNQQGPGIIFKD